jgi:hypothetical protein
MTPDNRHDKLNRRRKWPAEAAGNEVLVGTSDRMVTRIAADAAVDGPEFAPDLFLSVAGEFRVNYRHVFAPRCQTR